MPEDLELDSLVPVRTTINGRRASRMVSPRMSLSLFLREEIGMTSVHLGCEHGVCGACTISFDGYCMRSCLLLAAQADGAVIETLEGATATGRIADLQDEFVTRGALQCGFCTPGVLLTAAELLETQEHLSRGAIRDGLSGNICRCTGYQSIVDAVEAVALARADKIERRDELEETGKAAV
jgi:carbon-monoxide dehydrogenase small subunit